MLSNKEIKKLSIKQLSGKWGKMALLTLCIFLIVVILGRILAKILGETSMIAQIVVSIVSFLLSIGVLKVSLRIANGGEFSLEEMKANSRVYLRGIFLSIIRTIVQSIPYIIFFTIAIFAVLSMTFTNISAGVSSPEGAMFNEIMGNIGFQLVIVILLLIILTTAISIFIETLFFASTYLIVRDHDDIGTIDSISYSFKLMKGHKLDLFKIYLTFVGWTILSVVTAFIGLLWIVPYMNITLANFFLEVIKDKEELAREMGVIDSEYEQIYRTYKEDVTEIVVDEDTIEVTQAIEDEADKISEEIETEIKEEVEEIKDEAEEIKDEAEEIKAEIKEIKEKEDIKNNEEDKEQ
ncbi:DUF975 family protein [Peptostreptococcus faecalis]|uniref:DUF975 family protein n=1 Tax=Peptostreptococcus faecalis TaxID=2045015 RepID=UPI0015E129B6|nr:DUF975 family protein [Peptostreptococcus faecalis]